MATVETLFDHYTFSSAALSNRTLGWSEKVSLRRPSQRHPCAFSAATGVVAWKLLRRDQDLTSPRPCGVHTARVDALYPAALPSIGKSVSRLMRAHHLRDGKQPGDDGEELQRQRAVERLAKPSHEST